jgi:hypothetical protein
MTYSIISTGNVKSYLGLEFDILRNMLHDYGFKESNSISERVNVSFGVPNH